ncbi:MAG: antibiotic biosynthesis monooxygenase [Bacteroidota bacterium]
MVRVIYRWDVPVENFEAFEKTWRSTTNRIHESVEGALGSFMLRSLENENEVITIAKWDSLASWQNFWGNENPEEMTAMRKLGKRISAEVFEEIDDHTR